mmetsp:Transcript_86946/g.245255  ORF Transcript_86946/g.245255 Transcript_86946/m.245255 type:complete len:202 (+) Transcript_86946:366-971(+)
MAPQLESKPQCATKASIFSKTSGGAASMGGHPSEDAAAGATAGAGAAAGAATTPPTGRLAGGGAPPTEPPMTGADAVPQNCRRTAPSMYARNLVGTSTVPGQGLKLATASRCASGESCRKLAKCDSSKDHCSLKASKSAGVNRASQRPLREEEEEAPRPVGALALAPSITTARPGAGAPSGRQSALVRSARGTAAANGHWS